MVQMRIRRIVFAFAAVIVVLGGCGNEDSDDTSHHTIGVLSNTALLEPVLDGFKEQLGDLGYVEGENVTFLYDGPQSDVAELGSTAQTLIDGDVTLILALGLPAAQAARDATGEAGIPIVFVPVENPVEAGLAESLTHPGGNTTGISYGANDAKRFEWLTKLVPAAKRIYVPYNPETGSLATAWEAINTTAEMLGVEVLACECADAEDLGQALRTFPPDTDAVFLLADPTLARHLPFILIAARQSNLPVAAPTSELLGAGALFAFGMDMPAAGKQAARMAVQILEGSQPSELPIEIADSYLTINLMAADALELEISDAILRQANTVVTNPP